MGVGLRVVLDDLEKVMLAVFEDHEDAFVFEDDLLEVDYVEVRELRTQ